MYLALGISAHPIAGSEGLWLDANDTMLHVGWCVQLCWMMRRSVPVF